MKKTALSLALLLALSTGLQAKSLSDYLYTAGFRSGIAKGHMFFDTTSTERYVRGAVDLSKPAGTMERLGLDAAEIKGPIIGPEGTPNGTTGNVTDGLRGCGSPILLWWIDNFGTGFGIPAGYVCQNGDGTDVVYLAAGGNDSFWGGVILQSWCRQASDPCGWHPLTPIPTTLPPAPAPTPTPTPAPPTTPTPAPAPATPVCVDLTPQVKAFDALVSRLTAAIDQLRQVIAANTKAAAKKK
jgi:hypothetical protein